MFKSSENLRLAAEMRALERVARPWREARTSWFDGTPESIEARIAATDRVLSYARAGYTPAHMELTVEADTARRELLAAKHRLLTDFLDDGARAFKGSQRVAGEGMSYDDTYRVGSRRTAGEYDEGIENLSRYLGDRLLNPNYARTYEDENGLPGLPGGWPKELAEHLQGPNAAYNAGYAASGHIPYLEHQEPWEAAGNDYNKAVRYNPEDKSSFDDGWLDYAADIPHKYNDPEGHAAYHAEINGA